MLFIMERELSEVRHEWVCSLCGYLFFNPLCLLDGPTPNYIVQHLKKTREQAFVDHVCLSPSEREVVHDTQKDSYSGR
jgi:hypothetical protein